MSFAHTLLLGSQLLVPVSEHVPTFNVGASCRAATTIAIADAQSLEACMKDEGQARTELVETWQTFSAPDRINCAAEASSIPGAESYVDLLVCLQLAKSADADQATKLKGARRRR
jgi:hypothetical protein